MRFEVCLRHMLKMAAWRAGVNNSTELENMCSSCVSNTKYICLKCSIPICINCSTFEDNEESEGWTAGKCVGYCELCFREKTLEQSDGRKKGQHEKLNGRDTIKEPAK